MKIKGGYTKKILSIDLNKEKAVLEEVSDDFALQYVGGRGWGAKLVWDNLKNNNFNINPLGPENMVVIAPGPLTGLYLPSSGKTSFVSISPATKIYGDSSMGGMFGVELRQAGYDALVLSGSGTANKWSYIWIDDDKIEIRDASKYKGKGCIETERQIKEDLGDEEVRVATIGPAGENLVKFACINSEWSRNAGRTGIGAVLGSKKVKAIVVRGSKDIPVYDMDRLVDVSNHAYEILMGHKLIEFWQQQGLMSVVDYINTAGVMPTHNFKDGYFKDAEKINGYIMERYKIGDTACFSCPMACGNVCLVKDGKYIGTVTEGPEYETACMFGSNVGISDFSAILRANYLCDELGVDTISTGNLIAVVIEGYENGILSLEDLDGVAIKWGEDEPILALIEKIAKREGIGNI
ncbi:MAG: aldehyde ferredoxin oxidoreductase family protein, partial [Methanosarcinales archaeon]